MKTLAKVLGVISLFLFFTGSIFKFYHISGAHNLQVLGLFAFSFGFSPLFMKVKLAEETRKDAKVSVAFFLFATVAILVAAQLKILELPGGDELVYFSLFAFMIYAVFYSQPQEGRKLKIRKDRQLAAVLVTDIVGYTKMMSENEEGGLANLEENRKVHKKWIARFRGHLLKEMGDGNIVIFYTATEAVLCGMEILQETKGKGRYALRMGIHISEIIFTDNDAFGDGVNVASRLSGQAQGGEMVVSESVYLNIRNRENIDIERLGPVELKNVDGALQLFRIKV